MFTFVSLHMPTNHPLTVCEKMEREFGLKVKFRELDFHGQMKHFHFCQIVTPTSNITDLKPDFHQPQNEVFEHDWTPNGLLIVYHGANLESWSVFLFEAEKIEELQPA